MPAPTDPAAVPETPIPNAELAPEAIPVDAGALAALDASLAAGEPPEATEPATGNEETPPGDEPEGGEEQPVETDPLAPKDGEPPAKTDEEVAAEAVAAEAVKKEGEADPNAPKPDAKPSDQFGELPKDVKAETRERFNTMKTAYDELAAQHASAVERSTAWEKTVESTGASPEQFGTMLGYLKAVNGGDRAGLERAYDMLTEEVSVIAKALGKPMPGIFDPLELPENADLKKRIDDEDIEPADALEIAQARAAKKIDSVASQTRTQADEEQRVVDSAINDIRVFGAERKAADPAAFNAKMAVIKPAIDVIIGSLPPAKWVDAVKDLYDRTVVPAAAQPRSVAKVPDPIRPTGSPVGAGGVSKQPGSALEAMEMALGRT